MLLALFPELTFLCVVVTSVVSCKEKAQDVAKSRNT